MVACLVAAEPIWKLGEPAALPPLVRMNGSKIEWPLYRGKVLIVMFWASWCPFCARQNPLLDQLYRGHRDRGLAVVTVSIDKSEEAARQYLLKHGYQFECGMATAVWQAIYRQRKGLPQLFVFDRAGVLRQIEVREMLDDEIEELTRYL
ncbi:MAG: TlpA family protein disulfide reductase [Betaproteobacteria bacterium]|nr:TlpA family protein disulfide reductase [Betaproteobacteria bacterium]